MLIISHALYAFWPYRRRSYLAVLVLSAVGMAAGQVWGLAGLPAARIGEANLLPGVVFAVLLQPAASRLAGIGHRTP